MDSITVPHSLPEILKNYVKAAIRSQPEDIISWSAEYFKTTDDQYISIGVHENSSTYKQDRTLFRILAFQLGTTVGTKERIEEVWSDLSLNFSLLEQIYKIGNFHGEHVNMVEFLGITFGHWTKSLKDTILLCCESFCKCLATDGYFLHVDVACKLYGFLAKLDCSRVDGNERHHDHADERNENDNNNTSRKRSTTMKTSRSLDTSLPVPFSAKKKPVIIGDICTSSLESVFSSPATVVADKRTDNCIAVNNESTRAASYRVPGIGPSVPDVLVQKVLEYFKKCSANNGGYVYEFDIENDQCPQMNAVNNNN